MIHKFLLLLVIKIKTYSCLSKVEKFGAVIFEWAPHSPDLNPPDFFLWGYLNDWVCKTNPRTIGELKKTSKRRLKPLTKKPGALWCPTSSAAWRCVSIRKEDIWSNCCRTGYTPVRVLIFYVIVFILIKSIFCNFCFILSIFVIVGFFLNNFQKRQPPFLDKLFTLDKQL